MPTLENIPLPAMTIVLDALDMNSIMNLSLVSRTLLSLSQCKIKWRKLYGKNFEDLWDENPDKMVKMLAMSRFEYVDVVKLESKQRRGILTWANLITALESRTKDFRLTLDCNMGCYLIGSHS